MEEEIEELLDEDFFDLVNDLFKNLYIEEGGVDNEDTAEDDCVCGSCKI